MRYGWKLVGLPAACLAALGGCQQAQPIPVVPAAVSLATADLAPPPPGQGVQMVAGPFAVPPGAEVQNNFYMKLPVDHEVWVDHIDIVYPPGSHHVSLFKSDHMDVPDHVDNTFDAMYPAWDIFANSQTGDLHWQLPEGVGLHFNAHQQLLVQAHYVNTLTQRTPDSDHLEVKVNFHFMDPAKVKNTMGMFFGVNPSLRILPHSSYVAQKAFSLSGVGLNQDVKVIAMNGHFHSRGKTFQVNRWLGGSPDNLGQLLYRSDNWQEPPFKIYNPPLPLAAGESLLYTITYVNNTDITIGFGNGDVDTKEHGNLFMNFYPGPKDGHSLYDTQSSQFQEINEI